MAEKIRIDQRVQKISGQQINIAGDIIFSPPPPPQILVPHLPPPPRDFTSRDEELQDLLAGFDRGTTITGLRGMGGIGKTALAYALAERLIDRYPDGQILVDLRGTSPDLLEPADAMARVIRAFLGSDERLPEDQNELRGLYNSVLDGRRVLLLLDNAADDRQVRPLLPPPTCGVIVTSRRKFSLPGLVAMDLDVLPMDKAVNLLLKLWKPNASLSTEQIHDKDLNEIARLCGFLPLALRAVGSLLANSPDLSPAQYARELQDERQRLERIGREGVDLDVGASLDLSYRRMSAETASVFRLLSIFPADFDSTAEETVCQDGGHRHLSELVRWSLVEFQRPEAEDEVRYHLHDLVRIFAASRQQDREKRAAEERHAEYFRSVLSASDEIYQQGGENVLAGLALFDREWANIQAGWTWAERSLGESFAAALLCSSYPDAGVYVLDLRLHPKERIRWLETAVAGARQVQDRVAEGRHLGNLGLAYADLGDARKAIEHYNQHLAIAREIGDRWGEGSALGNLGLAYAALGDARKAIDYHERALVIAREIGDRRNEGAWLGNLGLAYANLGEPRKAIEYHEHALAIACEIGDRRSEGANLGSLGLAYADLSEPRKAIEYYEHALAIAREIGDRRSEGANLGSLGLVYADLGDPRKAIEHYEQAMAIAREIGDRRSEGARLGNLGLAYAALGDARKAIDYHERALVIAREIGDRRNEGAWLGNLGLAYAALGDARKAIDYHERALVIDREIGDRRGEGNALGNLGNAYAALGDARKAIEFYEKALVIAREIGDRRGVEFILSNLGDAYAELGEFSKSIEFYVQCQEIAIDIGDKKEEGKSSWKISLVQSKSGQLAAAVERASEALKILNTVDSNYADQIKDWLLKQLVSDDREIRKSAIESLATSAAQDEEIQKNILQLMKDDDKNIRIAAIDALSSLVSRNADIKMRILDLLNDSVKAVQMAAATALGPLVPSDEVVRKSLLLYARRAGQEEPASQVRQFLEVAGFNIEPLENIDSFICIPESGKWRGKVILNKPIYAYCFFGDVLNREAIIKAHDTAQKVSDFETLFLFIDQAPSDDGWIEISALRSGGVQVIPIDDTIIQRGIELMEEHKELESHLSGFLGHRSNLYNKRHPVSDRLNFFGREAYAKELLESLGDGKPLALFGLRKMGKSSLLHYLRDTAKIPIAYVDLDARCELPSLFARILKAWQDAFRIKCPSLDWTPPLLSNSDPAGEFSAITHNLIDLLESKGYSPQLGLLLDEIEWITPSIQNNSQVYDSGTIIRYLSFARTLRGLVQETKNLGLMIVGVDPRIIRINRLNGVQNPFYQFFEEQFLQPLSRDDCIQMIRNIGSQMDLKYNDEAVALIADLSGRHPFVARQFCSLIVDDLSQDTDRNDRNETIGSNGSEEITLAKVQSIAELFIRDDSTSSLLDERGLWGEVTNPLLWPQPQVKENEAILTTLARNESLAEEVLLENGFDRRAREKSVFELKKRTVIDKDRFADMLKIQMKLFKNWISHDLLQDV